MRLPWLVALAAIGLGIALAADPVAPVAKGLAVHEWGVIRAYNDVELANADMRSTWQSLPKFVYGLVDQRHIPAEIVIIDAPVMYFHAPTELPVRVKVEFPGGRPAVWWPGNSNIDHHGGRLGAVTERATCDKHLEWDVILNP
jgi:hypothetical protein